MFAKEPLTIIE